jgi:hypothetical protein
VSEFEELYDEDYVSEPAPDEEAEPASSTGGEARPEPVYGSVEQFLAEYLLPVYRRAVSGTSTTWCAQWWRHSEAWIRLDGLWRSWEYLRLDAATGMSVWLRDHADPHMAVLLSADGPFKGCTPDQHATRPLKALPLAPVPEGTPDPTAAAGGLLGDR